LVFTKLQYQPFENKIDFLNAIAATQQMYPQCDQYKTNWLEKVRSKYKENTGFDL
jgi:hypothetical protein